MATPVTMVDGVTTLEASELNKYLTVGNGKIEVKAYYGRVRFNGASFEVRPGTDSAGIVTADLLFVGASTRLDITLTGFTAPPTVLTTKSLLTSYEAVPVNVTNVLLQLQFLDAAGAQIVTGVGDTNMDFNLWLLGF